MNKLEKIKGNSLSELEKNNEYPELENEQKEDRKFFSFFTFWKKMKKQDPDLDISESINTEDPAEKKGFSKYFNIRTAALVASVAVIAVAGIVKVRFSAVPVIEDEDGIKVSADDINAALADKAEESQASESEDYFALSVINRQRVRDEALEILLDLTNSDATDATAKADAYTEMTRMANEITSEANIESLVKAKGFNNCVAVVSGEDVNVVVESEGLSINQVAQIKEIVYLECGVHPDNVKIIEKAGV